ncbi:Rieske (2Fe-2S) protein [Paenibacillus sp. IB182496]|uniref:Rieske (2Fe-2S) protein n=1 Tax=Paenibacillus sabuli TaxID=2772509 RepID=A0A927BRK8_9BACL|nr:Rieske (2Fe-2S) protein [Paenibacillus sabuli]MBD2844178.1 Rieske (2Fe-2S) protein [Paenibacillus sabuli]
MTWHPVASVDELAEGTYRIVELQGRSIGVYHVKGKFYAVHNYCPHQGAEVCRGPVCGTALESEVDTFVFGREDEILRCPWHGWEFDLTTGHSLFSPRVRVRAYPVEVQDGQVCVKLGDRTKKGV